MSQFIMLLHDDVAALEAETSPEQIQAIIAEYSAWREQVQAQGNMLGGHKLKDEFGRSLVGNGGNVRIVDGPFTESKELLGGLFIIEADDYDHAIEISKTCPHLKFGRRIELRQIDLVD